jgi:hypothetical protein
MQQGILPFQYVEERSVGGMTALGGLPLYLELAQAARLPEAIDRHVRLRVDGQGWTDRQMVMSLTLLNLAGGESVDDLRVLEQDDGFRTLFLKTEHAGLSRTERRQLARRWRKERRRAMPSPSAVFRYLNLFHDPAQEELREAHVAFIPAPTEALRGIGRVNAHLVGFVQRRAPEEVATLDMDATLIEVVKQAALFSYQGYRAYQPLTTYWAEQGLVVHSEFRDGNVPAGFEQLRVFTESLALLPQGVRDVRLRSDTAGYQVDLLRYCAEGKDERFGRIEFAVGVPLSEEFRQAVAAVPETEWRSLEREVKGKRVPTGQEWAEVCFVPNWVGHRKSSPEYRYLAVRERVRQPGLPGLDAQLPFPVVDFAGMGACKVRGMVTNRDLPGDELIWWYRERCGKGEEVHQIMKEDLAGGRLPSALFGANAAWWGIAQLAFNLHRAMQRLVLGSAWRGKRLKAVRFGLINLPGRLVTHARNLFLRLTQGHPALGLLTESRGAILALARGSPA